MTVPSQVSATSTVHDGGAGSASPAAPLRVLLLEDSAADARLMRLMLKSQGSVRFELTITTTLAALLRELQQGAVDVILLDLNVPDSHGFKTFSTVHDQAPTIPIVVLSGLADEELALLTVREGAQDYLIKGAVDESLLLRSIRHACERSRLRSELNLERGLLRSVIDSVPDQIFVKDREGRFMTANMALVKALGLSQPQEVIGHTDYDFYESSVAMQLEAESQQVLRSGTPITNKEEFREDKDGNGKWYVVARVPLRDQAGAVIGTVGVNRDVTARRLAQEKLAETQQRLQAILESAPSLISVKDLQGRYLILNRRIEKVFGISAAGLVGRSVDDLLPAAQAKMVRQNDQIVMDSGVPQQFEEPFTTGDVLHIYLTTRFPIRDGRGQVTGIAAISTDITKRKEDEEQMRQLSQDLARSQNELLDTYQALRESHDQLKKAQMQLIQVEKLEVVGRIAAGVAHEVKNPLATIQMGVDYLEDGVNPDDPNLSLIIEEMQEAIGRADRIIREMVDFSSARELELTTTNVNELLKVVAHLQRTDLTSAGITINYELESDLPQVNLDRTRIEQVLINGLRNAIHAMPDGGTISLRTASGIFGELEHASDERWKTKLKKDDQVVQVIIDDQGQGINPQSLSRLFDPFFTTKATGSGTGLGLTVSRKIVDLHGGILTLDNRPEGGARFRVVLKVTGESVLNTDDSLSESPDQLQQAEQNQ